jgi:hypothetical protein
MREEEGSAAAAAAVGIGVVGLLGLTFWGLARSGVRVRYGYGFPYPYYDPFYHYGPSVYIEPPPIVFESGPTYIEYGGDYGGDSGGDYGGDSGGDSGGGDY